MLRQEIVKAKNGVDFRHTYSDAGMYIEREDGKRYENAYDLLTSTHTYIETDEPIPEREER